MIISAIVATAKNGVIGKAGGLPWYLPADLAHFKQTSVGHPVIMGRKTHESIGKALPDRQNIIITRDKNYRAEGCEVVGSIDQALQTANGADEVFIIGGQSIYELAMPKLDMIYLTKIAADIPGDKYFLYNSAEWREVTAERHAPDEKNRYSYEFIVLQRNP
jgi:dihydrofolate reductase